MDFHGFPWISMDFHGFPWISMDFHGFPGPVSSSVQYQCPVIQCRINSKFLRDVPPWVQVNTTGMPQRKLQKYHEKLQNSSPEIHQMNSMRSVETGSSLFPYTESALPGQVLHISRSIFLISIVS